EDEPQDEQATRRSLTRSTLLLRRGHPASVPEPIHAWDASPAPVDERVDAAPAPRLHVDERRDGADEHRQHDHATHFEPRVDEEEREREHTEHQHGIEEEQPDDVAGAESLPAS